MIVLIFKMATVRLCFLLVLIIKICCGQLHLLNKQGFGCNTVCNGPLQQALQGQTGLVANNPTGLPIFPQQNNMLNQQMGMAQNTNLNNPQIFMDQGNGQLNLQQFPNSQPNMFQQLFQPQQQNNFQQQIAQERILNQNTQTPNLQQSIQYPSTPRDSLQVNNQFPGLPTQVSQGKLLSNLGLTSSLPNFIPNVCSQQPRDQSSVVIPQNNAALVSNVPNAISNIPQQLFNSDFMSNNHIVIPLSQNNPNMQSNQASGSSSPSMDPSKGKFTLKSLHLQPLTQMPSQQPTNPIENQQSTVQSAPEALPQQANTQMLVNPPSYSNAVLQTPINQGAKSQSKLKAMLPLLLNMLKERGSCCGCRNNNNMNTCPRPNCINVNNKPQEPLIVSGYSNKRNTGQPQTSNKEKIPDKEQKSEECEDSTESPNKTRKQQKRKNEPQEDDEEEDEYSCEYED